ncbi:Putative mitochondrial carrier domain superfamily [Septoria linicola]|uniref:Mitochondrial carrier domain superfamily n=1 Tax=Septoria linicola TaxID=215465 RepID=A0A9Q9AFQ2_9PEZI|nr:Putative mitochondrial carrier domain superfamily [Septoria linicola]
MSSNSNTDIWIAGAFAAFTVDLVVYPLDTIKTRLQSPDYLRLYRNGSNTAFTPAFYRGVYQGVGSVIVATLPSSGAFFTTYEGIKSTLNDANCARGGDVSPYVPAAFVHAVASGAAELVSCAILTPAEVIKQNAQMVDNSSSVRVNATMQTIKRFRSNPLALWRGYTALAARNLPFTAMQFPMFERIKEYIRRYRDERGIRTNTLLESGVITAVSAGSGGSIAAVITTPVDVVKTRLMLSAIDNPHATSASTPRESLKQASNALLDATGKAVETIKQGPSKTIDRLVKPGRQSSIMVAREVVRQEGVKGLFRGGALRGVWTMIGSGLYLGVYESGRIYLSQRRGEEVDADDYARS